MTRLLLLGKWLHSNTFASAKQQIPTIPERGHAELLCCTKKGFTCLRAQQLSTELGGTYDVFWLDAVENCLHMLCGLLLQNPTLFFSINTHSLHNVTPWRRICARVLPAERCQPERSCDKHSYLRHGMTRYTACACCMFQPFFQHWGEGGWGTALAHRRTRGHTQHECGSGQAASRRPLNAWYTQDLPCSEMQPLESSKTIQLMCLCNQRQGTA